jgi:hypothetical protein
VEVHIEIRGSAEALDGRDAAAARPDQAPLGGAPPLPAEDGAQEHAQHRARESRVERELVAHRDRHRGHPLADRHPREDALDQVRGEFAHASPAARRAKPAPTAAERHDGRVPTPLTAHAQEAVLQPATLEVRFELPPDKRRPPTRPVLLGRPREEGRQVGRNRPVEYGLLRLAALVRRGRARDRAHGPAGEHASCRAGARARTSVVTGRCPAASSRGLPARLSPKRYRVTGVERRCSTPSRRR